MSLTLTAHADQVNNSQSTVTTTTVAQNTPNATSVSDSDNNNDQAQDINGYHPVTNNNSTTWQNASGQRANGWQTDSNQQWYLFNNGMMQTGWQYQYNNWYYMNPQTSIMDTGVQKINNNTYYFNEKHDGNYGAEQSGWQKINGSWYYLDPNHDGNYGAAKTGWFQSTAGNWYHFDNNGKANSGFTSIDGQEYYFDPSNAWMLTGWNHINGSWYFMNERHDGSYGAVKTGWFQSVAGNWYHFDNHGQANSSFTTVDGHEYYFDPSNAWMLYGWNCLNGSWYYMNPSHDGTFGAIKTGWNAINGQRYYLDPNQHGKMLTGSQEINGNRYYFNNSGAQLKGAIIVNNGHNLRYYDANTGILQMSVNLNGHQVNADPTTGDLPLDGLTNGLLHLGNDYFYYTNGHFVTSNWAKLNNRWYFFGSNGKALKGWLQRNNHWYYFDNAGAAHIGWFKSPSSGSWYYFDQTNAWALTGWQYINGNWYFFDTTNTNALTGDHWIYGVEYYFDPINANMYRNRWVNINGYTGHADNSGHVWYPEYRSQFSPTFVAEGCSVYSLAMLLSAKQYINIPYALSLLQQRQSGNIYSGAGFSLIIQPNSLVDLAHHFDSSVRNITGSSVQDIINLVNAGHPVQYYGYSSYERSYANKNHNKVIVGYRNGYFRVYDPCYWSAGSGAYTEGRNSYDWGAEAWVSISRFESDYYPNRQAITVD